MKPPRRVLSIASANASYETKSFLPAKRGLQRQSRQGKPIQTQGSIGDRRGNTKGIRRERSNTRVSIAIALDEFELNDSDSND
jgi:hypothetical protein